MYREFLGEVVMKSNQADNALGSFIRSWHSNVRGPDMVADADFGADLSRYPPRPFLKEQSIWAICLYRYGRRVLNRKAGLLRTIQLKHYWLMFRIVETLTE